MTAFQTAGEPDPARRTQIALHACPGQGSCGGMFTYNTMQTFIAVLGMEPLHMVAPPSDDPRRLAEFPGELVDCLVTMTRKGITPRAIVTPAALRNALTVAIAMGGSTNVALHSVEIARAAGLDLWKDVMSQHEFNALSHRMPVLINARPFGVLLDGGHRGQGRAPGDRQAAPRRRLPRRQQRSRAPARRWRSRWGGWRRRRPMATSSIRSRPRSRRPAASACCAATSRPRAARS